MFPSPNRQWKESPAHLLFLSVFLRPRVANDLPAEVDWKLVLGEEPQEVIESLLNAGMLTQASLGDHLAHRFTVIELKEMLRERALPLSGRKNDLVVRLVQSDPDSMEQAIGSLLVLKCSEKGREVWEQYQTRVNNEPPSRSELKELLARWGPRFVKWLKRHLESRIIGGAVGGVLGNLVYDSYKERSGENETEPLQTPLARPFLLPILESVLQPNDEEGTRLKQKNYDEHIVAGREHIDLGEYDLAIPELEQAIKLDPHNFLGHLLRGKAYHGLGDYTQAITNYNKAIELTPGSVAFLLRAGAYEDLGDYVRACAEYERIVEVCPQSAAFRCLLGAAYEKQGEFEQAIAAYDRAIELAWQETAVVGFGEPVLQVLFRACHNRGVCYSHLGDHRHAIADFDTALRLCEECHWMPSRTLSASTYYYRGIAHRSLEMPEKAIVDFRKALELVGEEQAEFRKKIDGQLDELLPVQAWLGQ